MTLPENPPLLEPQKPLPELEKAVPFPLPTVPVTTKRGLNLYVIYMFLFALLLGASITFYLSVKTY